MRETHLKHRLSKTILFFEILIILLLVLYYFLGGLTIPELTTLLGYFLPMTALYITVVIKFAHENRYLGSGDKVSTLFTSFTFYFILALFVLSILFVSLKALFNLIEFEGLKIVLLIIQTGFGIYAGYFLTELFTKKSKV